MLQVADLVPTLKGSGPFTVFVPTDAAFAKLPLGAVDTLLKPEIKPKLVKVLTYHVVGNKALTETEDCRNESTFQARECLMVLRQQLASMEKR